MSLLEQVRKWTEGKALGIRIRIQLSKGRQTLRLLRLSTSLLDAEIRLSRNSLPQLGEDEAVDNVIEYVARLLTKRPLLPEIGPSLQSHGVLAADLAVSAGQVTEVKRAASSYFLARAFYAELCLDEDQKERLLVEARSLEPAAVAIDFAGIRREVRDCGRRLKVAKAVLAERSAIKIDFSLSDISSVAGLVSVVFVASGFLYSRYFFASFGVDVSLFFSLGDYLAASIEQIRSAAFAAAVSLVTFAFGLRAASMRSKLEIRASQKRRRRERVAFNVFLGILWLAAAWALHEDKPNFHLFTTCGVLTAYKIADRIAVLFFRRTLVAATIIIGMLVFAVNVGVSVYERTYDLRHGKGASPTTVEVYFKDSMDGLPLPGRFIAATSNYLFMLAPDGKAVQAYPRDQLQRIIVRGEAKPLIK